MALSYNLGYQESISVHLTRRQNFAGKVYSNFPNIWEWVIYGSILKYFKFLHERGNFWTLWKCGMARTCTIITDEALQLPSQGQLRTALALSEEGQLPSVVSDGLWRPFSVCKLWLKPVKPKYLHNIGVWDSSWNQKLALATWCGISDVLS